MNNLVPSCLILLLLVASCDFFQPKKETILARVGNTYLYEQDLQALGLEEVSATDSVRLTSAFVDSWIQQQLLTQKALENLSQEQLAQTDSKVEDYRNSLLSYLYENELLTQKVDANVTEQQLEEFYQTNQKEFELDGPVSKFIYIKIAGDIKNADSLELWLNDYSEQDNDAELLEYCNYHAIECQLDPDIWFSFDELYETLALTDGTNFRKLQNGKVYVLESTGYKYLCKIIERKNGGSAPFTFVQDQIQEQILREREQQFIKQLKVDLYEAALKNNEIEIYDKE